MKTINGIDPKKIDNYKDAWAYAIEIDKTLLVHSFISKKRNRIITIQHMDGSYLELHAACFKKFNNNWFAVFSEHHGRFVFHKDDVKKIDESFSPKCLYYNKDF